MCFPRTPIRWVLFFLLAIPSFVRGEDLQFTSGAAAVYQKLKHMQSPVTVLHVVAHPDDEDGAMLTYCARQLGLRTLLFSLTRGEGGANLISDHFFDELGTLRTLEHAKAAHYYGNELFYSRAADYGYSKTLAEAMDKWQRGVPMLEELVELIRTHRPRILLSRFAGDARDGHGQHQMAGVLSRLAIAAAGDPEQFPDQLRRGLEPHHVQKFYVRAGSPWRPPKPADWTVQIKTGTRDPVLGKSPAQIARFGLGFQRSQGFSGHDSDPGPQSTYYRLQDASSNAIKEASILDGVEVAWSALPLQPNDRQRQLLTQLDQQLHAALTDWNPTRPERTRAQVLAIREVVLQLLGTSPSKVAAEPLERLMRQISATLWEVSGISIHAVATGLDDAPLDFVVPGEEIRVKTRISNQSRRKIGVPRLTIRCGDQAFPIDLQEHVEASDVLDVSQLIRFSSATKLTRPAWSRSSIEQPLYELEDEARPWGTSGILAEATLDLSEDVGQMILDGEVRVKRRDPEFGNVSYPLAVVPDKSVQFSLKHRVVPKSQLQFKTRVRVRNSGKMPNTAHVKITLPPMWSCQPAQHELAFEREGEERTVTFDVMVPRSAAVERYELNAVVESDQGVFAEGYQTVTARDLGRMNVYHAAVQKVQLVDVKLSGDPRVGYIAGSGDRVAESLSALGVYPILLGESDLAAGDLSSYDVILVGVRAYAVRSDIRTHNRRLLDYVSQGGVLIVQYQTPEFDANFGPYPYQMGRSPEEVSEENAKVTILRPEHPIFRKPNAIGDEDFSGWFEQRGSKFWQSWDARYTPLLACNDQAQPPQRGGQLVAEYGQGLYVYSAYAWYRQLPQGVPGAYRIMANLLSLPATYTSASQAETE